MPASRRHPRLDEPAVLCVRATLEHSEPPIHRLLDLRSDLRLDQVHQVLQVAFGWTDSHLHRFALGESVFHDAAEMFLCPFDVEEQDEGVPETTVRLDETLASPGDVLRYCYDYGDHWALDLVLEAVLPEDRTTSPARCVDGDRAAPPDDCGGLRTSEELARVLDDPARFDTFEVNEVLGGPILRFITGPFTPELVAAVLPLTDDKLGHDIVLGLVDHEPTSVDRREALKPIVWFLERIGADGLAMTAAGWLRPEDVRAAAEVVPGGPDWIGKKNREIDTVPVHQFRLMLGDLGLTRKYKGRLKLSRAAAAAYTDPDRLWQLIARTLPRGKPRSAQRLAELLALAQVAATGRSDTTQIARAMTELGWRLANGAPVDEFTAYDSVSVALQTLTSLEAGPRVGIRRGHRFSAAARQLAYDALLDHA